MPLGLVHRQVGLSQELPGVTSHAGGPDRDPDAEEAENVAARVAKQLVGPYSVGGHEVPGLEASVGVAVRPPGVRSYAGQLLREADLAMYQTKRHAR